MVPKIVPHKNSVMVYSISCVAVCNQLELESFPTRFTDPSRVGTYKVNNMYKEVICKEAHGRGFQWWFTLEVQPPSTMF